MLKLKLLKLTICQPNNSNNFKFQKPTAVPARTYIELLFEWVDQQIHDESIFPTDCEVEFPKNFKEICMKILSRHSDQKSIISFRNSEIFQSCKIENFKTLLNRKAKSKIIIKNCETSFKDQSIFFHLHHEPSMMSQGQTPWKDPRGGFTRIRGVLPSISHLERPLRPL